MRRKCLILMLISAALPTLSCSSGQQLVAIEVRPATVVFGGINPALFVQLTAIGTYAHPPATKDITNQVTWTSNIVEVAQVTSTGKVSPNIDCGVAPVTASFITNSPKGNEITGTTSVTVDGPSPCPSVTP